MKRRVIWVLLPFLLVGCSEKMQKDFIPIVDSIIPQNIISSDDRKSIIQTTNAVIKSSEDITPNQEYYIGRTVASTLFGRYKAYDNTKAFDYVTLIGNQLVYHSKMPTTFGGYHFQILDSEEINAFAAPGGYIFITRGMLKCAKNEDQLAAILAHEIAHVVNRHGLRTIKSSRWSEMGSLLVVGAAKHYSKNEFKNLVSTFEGSISDIIGTMTVNGYSREFEYEADEMAVIILEGSGYDPKALSMMLKVMEQKVKSGDKGFGSTHPLPAERIKNINNSSYKEIAIPQIRNKRFADNIKYL
jgi:beta-barrel assembly-enhancing protease